MSAVLRTRVAVVVMAALLALYLVFAIRYGVLLIQVGQPISIVMGAAVVVLPLIAFGVLGADLVFTIRAERLGERLEREGALPTEELPLTPSGRIERSAADEVFPAYKAAVEAAPADWRAWYRLGLAYDACGDRRRARWATREALKLAAHPAT